MAEVVLFEVRDGGVAVVSLNRPEKRNAINFEMAQGIDAALQRTEADPAIGAVVLTTTVDTIFSAGADLTTVTEGKPSMVTDKGGFGGLVEYPRTKPWIAAPKGMVIGGGFELCLACEMIVAADNCTFALPEAKRGLLALAGGATKLPKILPFAVAIDMLLTGDPLPAQRAYDLGLANRLAPVADVVETAVELGRKIAVAPRWTITEAMRLARAGVTENDETCKALCREAGILMSSKMDTKEGPRAFFEKRAPSWDKT